MRNVPSITWREINATFFSPLAYVVLTIFLFFSGFFFFLIADQGKEASMSGVIGIVSFLFLVATPFITMRLISEELRSGTIETLMTAPVTDTEVILGKYFGALAFFFFMLVPTLGYVIILSVLGDPDAGPMISAYLGLLLMGCNFIALGTFCSSLTRNQIVAGVLALVVMLIVWVLGAVGEDMTGTFGKVLEYMGTLQHMRPFSQGRIAFRDCFYFVSFSCFWLFLGVRVLESRRWR